MASIASASCSASPPCAGALPSYHPCHGKYSVGLVQCLSTLCSFSRVLWPEVFTNYISAIDQFTVEAFSIVPAECIVGGPLQP